MIIKWEEMTAEQAYNMAYKFEVDYRLPNRESVVDAFMYWHGDSGITYTGQFVIYFENSDIPHILDPYDTVLVHIRPDDDLLSLNQLVVGSSPTRVTMSDIVGADAH